MNEVKWSQNILKVSHYKTKQKQQKKRRENRKKPRIKEFIVTNSIHTYIEFNLFIQMNSQ